MQFALLQTLQFPLFFALSYGIWKAKPWARIWSVIYGAHVGQSHSSASTTYDLQQFFCLMQQHTGLSYKCQMFKCVYIHLIISSIMYSQIICLKNVILKMTLFVCSTADGDKNAPRSHDVGSHPLRARGLGPAGHGLRPEHPHGRLLSLLYRPRTYGLPLRILRPLHGGGRRGQSEEALAGWRFSVRDEPSRSGLRPEPGSRGRAWAWAPGCLSRAV